MTKEELIRTLKEDLGIQKEIIALRAAKEPPANIPQYEGQAVPGMCALLGELLREKQACHTGKPWLFHVAAGNRYL